jgi:phosphoglycerol transferase MdoB-like AlkP superfamily enzyme
MKNLKCLLAVIVAGIVANALDFYVQGKLLTDAYYSKMESMKHDTPVYWFVILDFIAVLVFACVYKRVASVFAEGAKGGASAGFLFGVLVCFPGYLFMFLMTKGYPQSLAWISMGYGIVWYVIVGAIIGALRTKPAPVSSGTSPAH